MFDELLDPEIEQLIEILDENDQGTDQYTGSIAAANPVTLRCQSLAGAMVTVDYDGYYSPSGNRITWPLGPSLVIKPNDPTLIATNAQCEITINDSVVDKEQTPVESAQRGPYKFRIAPIQVLAIEPADDPDGDHPVDPVTVYAGVFVQFNTYVDPDSFCDEGTSGTECEFSFTPDEGGAGFSDDSDTEYSFFTNNPGHADTMYTFQFLQGGKIADRCGAETTFGAPSVADQTLTHFLTGPFKYNTASIVTGETASPLKKLSLSFSNVIDLASLEASEYSISPAPMTATVAQSALGNAAVFNGLFNLNTEYTFTLNAGATIEDANGAVHTQATALTIKWKTQPAITVAYAPAEGATITKATATSPVGVTLTFNSTMLGNDLTEGTEYSFESNGSAVTGFTLTPTGCGATSTSCTVAIRKDLAPGTYKFTLKAGATMSDLLGNVYTQATDKVINFTVKAPAPPPPPAPDCL